MRKINALLNATPDSQFSQLAKQANAHLNLQQLWEAAAPRILSQSSFAGSLDNGLLTIFADNASVATKIKLSSTSLLSELQNLVDSDPFYSGYKVTAITVKMQVKSLPMPVKKAPRKLSKHAADSLQRLADNLDDSSLKDKILKLSSRQ